ncbi:MAG: 50S ribosomal protein L29 [Nanoarchaeota archaeon]
MAIIKKKELVNLNATQIESKLTELSKEYMKLNAQRAVGTAIENPGRIKLIRRTIARLYTRLNQIGMQTLAGGKPKV